MIFPCDQLGDFSAVRKNFAWALENQKEFEMAEKIIQFKAKKEIFEKAATKLACSDCKAVLKDVPIYQTIQGDVLCSVCKPKSKLSEIFRNSVLEDLLMSLPISCKYQKNGCPVVLQD